MSTNNSFLSEKEYFEIRLESIGGLGANLCGKMLGELGALYLKLNAISGVNKVPIDEALYYLRIYKDELPDNIKEKAEQLINENK